MRRFGIAALGLILAAASGASAAETASAVISQTGTSGPNFDYSIVLHNTSTDGSAIGTFWYAWVPGEDFMKSNPVSVTNPNGWGDNITSSAGFAIQWVAGAGSAIPAGGSDTFSFVSPDDFATMTGNSPYYSPATPIGTSYVYSGGPFSDGGFRFVVAVPEPASIGMLRTLAVFALKRSRRVV
ncbi:MAG TPA: hypothetical protein VGG19_13765 [Tepidisphaeraceae bacterium]|jgi:hypothetical protein